MIAASDFPLIFHHVGQVTIPARGLNDAVYQQTDRNTDNQQPEHGRPSLLDDTGYQQEVQYQI
jgi:hypothetical protein